MAQYATLKAAITAYVKTNGAQGITGQGLQNILVGMVDILGKYFQNFGGLATPAGSFTAGDENVSFLAIEAGTYTNFGGVTLDGKSLHVLVYDGSWDDIDTGIATSLALAETLADYAKVDGNYPQLTAGRAKNIDGKSTLEGTFLFRTTAGDAEVATGPATVQEVKGNTVAWNQLVDPTVGSHTGATVSNGLITVSATVAANSTSLLNFGKFDIIGGHTYQFRWSVVSGSASSVIAFYYSPTYKIENTSGSRVDTISASASNSVVILSLKNETGDAVTFSFTCYIQLFDLTLMGIDNLTTVAQVEAWLAANVGNKPYYPASSKLLPTKLLGLKTRGFNQWDEEWELGGINSSTGQNIPDATTGRSKNYIPIFGNTEYYIKSLQACYLRFYDADKNYIGYQDKNGVGSRMDAIMLTPDNARYFRFVCNTAIAANSICINLSWDGSKDGEYEPYVEHDYNLDVTKFYGKLNGEGELVQCFPNGMRKAGSVCDLLDLVNAEADVKVGSVDMGTLEWDYIGGANARFKATPSPATTSPGNSNMPPIVCSKYAPDIYTNIYAGTGDKQIGIGRDANIYVRDTAYSDAATFTTAMDGVYLFYELATPLHYTDLVYRDNGVDTPVEALNILVDNWSTEEEIIAAPEASGDPNSCAATLDILYGIDAAEQLDTINQSGIFTTDLKANLSALIGVINTNCAEALGGTLAISENPTDKVYSFIFTPAAE